MIFATMLNGCIHDSGIEWIDNALDATALARLTRDGYGSVLSVDPYVACVRGLAIITAHAMSAYPSSIGHLFYARC